MKYVFLLITATTSLALCGCGSSIADTEANAKKDLEQKYSDRHMKIEKITLEKDSNGEYNGQISTKEDAGSLTYKLTISKDEKDKKVYSITLDSKSAINIAKKCLESKGFSVESVDLKPQDGALVGLSTLNAQGGTYKYATKAAISEDNSASCSVDFTKDTLTELVKNSVENKFRDLPYYSSIPSDVKMRIEDLRLVKKDDTTYHGIMQLKFDGLYGYDRQLEVDVTVDPNDLSFTWKTS